MSTDQHAQAIAALTSELKAARDALDTMHERLATLEAERNAATARSTDAATMAQTKRTSGEYSL